jgi:CRISPR/Cas system-associated endonuclease/helicase Cas3
MIYTGETSQTTSKEPEFSFASKVSTSAVDKPVSVKLDNNKAPEQQSNYNLWVSTMSIILQGMMCYEIVVEGLVPSEMDNQAEVAAFKHLSYQVQVICILVVSSNILEKIVEHRSPHEMWTWLHTEYYQDTAYTFVYPITNLTSLLPKFTTSDPLASFLSSFEKEWLQLQNLAKASKDNYYKNFSSFP